MSTLDRRQLLAGASLLPALADRNLVREENQQPGTTDWQLTYVRADAASESGWGKWGVRPGEAIDFFVSTRPAGSGWTCTGWGNTRARAAGTCGASGLCRRSRSRLRPWARTGRASAPGTSGRRWRSPKTGSGLVV